MMERLVGSRIVLTPRPFPRRETALEVAMLGHCPGRARLERLLAMTGALNDMRTAGFGATVDRLLAGERADLFDVPIPLRSSAEFHDIFPDTARTDTDYGSVIAGKRAWLAQAVDDFFANGGDLLWTVRIDETDIDGDGGRSAFLPLPDSRLYDADSLRGLDVALAIPSLGLLALPDLERLQIPANLPDIARVRLENPAPAFHPCSHDLDDDHRERRHSHELPTASAPLGFDALLAAILGPMTRHRPDVQCLLTLPLAYAADRGAPALDPNARRMLSTARSSNERGGHLLRHVQFLFPYLRGPRFSLRSPVGVVAGLQARTARQVGPWRSIAARAMATDALPWPRLSQAAAVALRNEPGIGVLRARDGRVSLDDERLVVPALPPSDYVGRPDAARLDGFRSGEIMRFLGFLRRQLRSLGEVLVFDTDPDDPRPRMLLHSFFRALHARGALRGALPEDAFRITASQPQEGALLFEIEIAPAFPIDSLHLTFANRDGNWRAEVSGV